MSARDFYLWRIGYRQRSVAWCGTNGGYGPDYSSKTAQNNGKLGEPECCPRARQSGLGRGNRTARTTPCIHAALEVVNPFKSTGLHQV